MLKRVAVTTATLMLIGATSALAVTKGSSIFAIQVGGGTADLLEPSNTAPTYAPAYDHSENRVRGQYMKMLSDDYAFAVSAGIGFFGEENKPGAGAPAATPTRKYTQSSMYFRVGGDRVVNVGERAFIYFGPGVEFWSGKAEFKGYYPATVETEPVTRISFAGRMGGGMMIGENWGLTGDIGHKIGIASGDDRGAKTSWMPSSFDGHGGLFFSFGGK